MSFYQQISQEELLTLIDQNPVEVDLRFALVQKLFQEGEFEEAFTAVELAEQAVDFSSELQAAKSLCLMNLGAVEEGHDLLQKTIRHNPSARFQKRIIEEIIPSFTDKSLEQLTDPEQIRSTFEETSDYLSGVSPEFQKRMQSLVDITSVMVTKPEDRLVIAKMLESHIEEYPNDINAILDLARIHTMLGQTASAKSRYQQVIELDADAGIAYFELAMIENDPELAITHARKGLAICPQHFDGRYNLGIFLSNAGRLDEALFELSRIPADSDCYVWSLTTQASVHLEKDDLEKAAQAANRALCLRPDDTEIRNFVLQVNLLKGEPEVALDIAQKSVAENPEDAELLFNLGVVFTELGNLQDALNTYEQAYEIQPNDSMLIGNMSFVLGELGHNERALELLEDQLLRDEREPQLWLNHAILLNEVGHLSRALESGYRTIELDPKRASAYWIIACVHAKQDDQELCLKYLELAIHYDSKLSARVTDEPALQPFLDDDAFVELLKSKKIQNDAG